MKTTKIKLAKVYKELFNTKWRHIVFHGGRSSGKSTATAYALLLRGRQSKLRILATREFQNSIADSVHKLLKDLIEKHDFTDYEVQRETIRNTITGTEFIFKGLRKDSQAIKSLEGVDLCWVEEAQTITKGSIDILIPTIRKDGSQIIWTFNRITELDPVYVELCKNPSDDTYIAHVNSDVLEAIGQLPQTMIDEREKMKRQDPSLYAHVWLGQPLAQGENSIIAREAVLQAMERDIEAVGAIEIGVDVARMGNDRTEFVKRKGLKEIGRETYTKLRTTEVCDRLEVFAGYNKEILIKIDDTGVGGGVTDEMMRRGYNIMPINFGAKPNNPDKYPNLISEAWFHMASIMDDVSLVQDNELLMELSNRQWVMDSKGRRGVESKESYKKRGFRSPDKADATILCFYTPEYKGVEWATADELL
jgi:phage terminase large subunit